MIAVNQIPVRLEMLDGLSKWRGVLNLEHATLCRAFGLDQATYWFELPSSARAEGSNRAGAGMQSRRLVNGFVFAGGATEPVGKLTICRPGDRFWDVDPTDKRDFFRLDK